MRKQRQEPHLQQVVINHLDKIESLLEPYPRLSSTIKTQPSLGPNNESLYNKIQSEMYYIIYYLNEKKIFDNTNRSQFQIALIAFLTDLFRDDFDDSDKTFLTSLINLIESKSEPSLLKNMLDALMKIPDIHYKKTIINFLSRYIDDFESDTALENALAMFCDPTTNIYVICILHNLDKVHFPEPKTIYWDYILSPHLFNKDNLTCLDNFLCWLNYSQNLSEKTITVFFNSAKKYFDQLVANMKPEEMTETVLLVAMNKALNQAIQGEKNRHRLFQPAEKSTAQSESPKPNM